MARLVFGVLVERRESQEELASCALYCLVLSREWGSFKGSFKGYYGFYKGSSGIYSPCLVLSREWGMETSIGDSIGTTIGIHSRIPY